ncbi:MAG: WbqC family protein [Bacteroidales bacterium]|nr:WbqC family protein [Bacteroidales bacterium]
MLLSVAYFPPVEYFALLAGYSSVYVEACENYQKQSWRNRCRILTANGTQDLNVPVVHENGTFALPIRQIRVDYSTPWVIRTERAIESAYSSSPFFIYYKDELFGILDSRPTTLWELDMRLIRFFCAKIGIAPDIRETLSFVPPLAGQVSGNPGFAASSAGEDYRQAIHPKRPNTILADLGLDRPYWQVFRERFGFVPGLSVMDLLFNEGPESICWLR